MFTAVDACGRPISRLRREPVLGIPAFTEPTARLTGAEATVGCGAGRWIGAELQGPARRAAAGIYLALVADASLALIGARDAIVIEGRFAEDMSFLGMLAALRPTCDVFASHAADGIASGALRLIDPAFMPRGELTKIAPLDADVTAYAARWRQIAAAGA